MPTNIAFILGTIYSILPMQDKSITKQALWLYEQLGQLDS